MELLQSRPPLCMTSLFLNETPPQQWLLSTPWPAGGALFAPGMCSQMSVSCQSIGQWDEAGWSVHGYSSESVCVCVRSCVPVWWRSAGFLSLTADSSTLQLKICHCSFCTALPNTNKRLCTALCSVTLDLFIIIKDYMTIYIYIQSSEVCAWPHPQKDLLTLKSANCKKKNEPFVYNLSNLSILI